MGQRGSTWPPFAWLTVTWGISQRMKASESTRLKAESSLREELESRWQKLQELAEERVQALRGQCKVGSTGWA